MAEYGGSERKATAAERYLELSTKREMYLAEARACSELTIPRLIPPEDVDMGIELVTPAQSDGAKGVNSLSAKFLMSTVPPNHPVFKLETDEVADFIMASEDTEVAKEAQKIRKNLDRIPRAALILTEAFGHRPVIFEGFKHLIVSGNVLFWFLDDKENYGRMRSVPLSRYVVLRDSLGFVLEVIIRDGLSAANLPAKLQAMVNMKKTPVELLREASEIKSDSSYKSYAIYTYACWDPAKKKYKFHQEFEGDVIDGTDALYTKESFSLCALRFNSSDGEDYGRGHVEEYRGVLTAIEALAQAETAKAISMSEHRLVIGSGSTLRARDIMNSPQGSPIDAEPGSIEALSYPNNGLADIRESKFGLQRDWNMACLVETSIQRPGERVTAEEIRTMINLLNATLGGIHSTVSVDFLSRYTQFLLRILKKEQGIDINRNGSGAIRPRIVTGLAALGQSAEGQQFMEAQKVMSELLGPVEYAKKVNADILSGRIMGYYGVEDAGLFKDDERLQQERVAEQQAAQNEAVAPNIVNAAAQMATAGRG